MADPEPGRELEAFRAYRADPSAEARNALVADHLGLGRSLARRFAGAGEPQDDLEQVAFEGLVKAVERFDPERGASFAAFAVPTIVGEIKRHFRDHTWATKVPRAAKELAPRLTKATEELEQPAAPGTDSVRAVRGPRRLGGGRDRGARHPRRLSAQLAQRPGGHGREQDLGGVPRCG